MYTKRRAVIGAAVVLVLAGCGGEGDDAPFADAEGVGSADSGAAGDADTTAEVEPFERQLDATGWWGGFAVTADSVVATPVYVDTVDGPVLESVDVAVGVTWENQGDDADVPPSPVLTRGGEAIVVSMDGAQVSGRAAVDDEIVATIDPGEETLTGDGLAELVDGLALTFGEAGDNQTVLPLDGATEVETIEPVAVPSLAGTLVTPQVEMAVSDARLVPSYAPGDRDTLVLSFHVHGVCGADCPITGTYTEAADFTLVAPGGGTPQAPSGESNYVAAVYANPTEDTPRNRIAFELPVGSSGGFTVSYQHEKTDKPATLAFTL